MSLLSRATSALYKVPVAGKYYRSIGNAAGNYVTAKTDKEAKKYRNKVLKPFKYAAAGVAALAAAPVAASGAKMAAAGIGRLGANSALRAAAGRAATRTARTIGRTAGRLSRAAKSPKTIGVAAGVGALGAAGVGVSSMNWGRKDKTIRSSGPITMNKQDSPTKKDDSLPERGNLSWREYARKYGADAAAAAKEARERQKLLNQIGRGWNDITPEHRRISSLVGKGKDELTDYLSDMRKRWRNNVDTQERLSMKQLEDQRKLLQESKHNAMTDIARDARDQQFSAYNRLGIHGAADSSAALMASRGIQRATEKSRRQLLKGAKEQLAQLQQEQRALQLRAQQERENIYAWAEQQKRDLLAAFKEQQKALKRLMKSAPEWRKRDLEDESDAHLQRYIAGLSAIEEAARAKRDELHQQQALMDKQMQDLQLQAMLTFSPAELEAEPVEGLTDLENDYIPDYFDPQPGKKKKKKKRENDILASVADTTTDTDAVTTL